MRDEPDCPPIVMCGLTEPHPAFQLCWELAAGEWWAWVAWIRERRGQPYRHVVSVHGESVRPIEAPEAYRSVPRRVRGLDGVVRPWSRPVP